ncbi:putative hydrolase of the HAD superfamily [Modicisalibacter ilicicola DSM 19980]|uniref:Putative hydrolase of the HAD superfamily n=1 Tax=Modicisalibacter ilicicola DSM 19980 TaxID=1121942 RepID=A0A1M5DQ88_9GAMM|nr:HAD-IA family hydrolase [Halomonas ilicicola]SHF69075.1 putative hydrolase of the HAD superfamily [Halomonas ilicicola DSM 19980]
MRNPEVLLFDVGGVLVDWDGTRGLVTLTEGRLDHEQARRFWMEFEPLKPFEKGHADGREFAQAAVSELGLDMTPGAFLDAFNDWMRGPFSGALELVERIRPEYRRAVLSNSNLVHWRRLIEDYGLARPFETLFVSHEIGQRKPEPSAYRVVFEGMGLPAETFVFFDDNPECVEAAQELGMQAMQVRGLTQLNAILEELGVLMPEDGDDGVRGHGTSLI